MSNPQGKAFVPLERPKQRYVFQPGVGMVPAQDDIDAAMLYDINEAILDSEDEAKRRKSYANVGYASMKRRG